METRKTELQDTNDKINFILPQDYTSSTVKPFDFQIFGIVASANDSESLEQSFENLKDNCKNEFVIFLHLQINWKLN